VLTGIVLTLIVRHWRSARDLHDGAQQRLVTLSLALGMARDRAAQADPETLTERELAVLALMAEGRSNHAIANQLYMSPKTVETHVGNLFAKLGLLPRSGRSSPGPSRSNLPTPVSAGQHQRERPPRTASPDLLLQLRCYRRAAGRAGPARHPDRDRDQGGASRCACADDISGIRENSGSFPHLT
jgi:DNA-binding CsgD family transcriptional regulator